MIYYFIILFYLVNCHLWITYIAKGDDTLSSLIDSGALHANYCSTKVATWVKDKQKQEIDR